MFCFCNGEGGRVGRLVFCFSNKQWAARRVDGSLEKERRKGQRAGREGLETRHDLVSTVKVLQIATQSVTVATLHQTETRMHGNIQIHIHITYAKKHTRV